MKPIKRVRSNHEMKAPGLHHEPGKVIVLILRTMLLVLLLDVMGRRLLRELRERHKPQNERRWKRLPK